MDPPLLLDELLGRGGFLLTNAIRDMLADHPDHLTERRGCGFTQTTRVLAQAVHRIARHGHQARLFAAEDPPPEFLRERAVGLPPLYRTWMELLADILERNAAVAPEARAFDDEHTVGSCAMAEKFFLEIAHGAIPRKGLVRVFTYDGTPAVVEKIGMGDNHSALNLLPLTLNGVKVPVGSLLAVRHDLGDEVPGPREPRVAEHLLAETELQLLRITTLAATPEERLVAFGPQLNRQTRQSFLRPQQTTLDELRASVSTLLESL